jgi:hypothetical protein
MITPRLPAVQKLISSQVVQDAEPIARDWLLALLCAEKAGGSGRGPEPDSYYSYQNSVTVPSTNPNKIDRPVSDSELLP